MGERGCASADRENHPCGSAARIGGKIDRGLDRQGFEAGVAALGWLLRGLQAEDERIIQFWPIQSGSLESRCELT